MTSQAMITSLIESPPGIEPMLEYSNGAPFFGSEVRLITWPDVRRLGRLYLSSRLINPFGHPPGPLAGRKGVRFVAEGHPSDSRQRGFAPLRAPFFRSLPSHGRHANGVAQVESPCNRLRSSES